MFRFSLQLYNCGLASFWKSLYNFILFNNILICIKIISLKQHLKFIPWNCDTFTFVYLSIGRSNSIRISGVCTAIDQWLSSHHALRVKAVRMRCRFWQSDRFWIWSSLVKVSTYFKFPFLFAIDMMGVSTDGLTFVSIDAKLSELFFFKFVSAATLG